MILSNAYFSLLSLEFGNTQSNEEISSEFVIKSIAIDWRGMNVGFWAENLHFSRHVQMNWNAGFVRDKHY